MSTSSCIRPMAETASTVRQVEKLRRAFFQRQLRNGRWLSGLKQTAERRVGDAGHGREHDRGVETQRADLERGGRGRE